MKGGKGKWREVERNEGRKWRHLPLQEEKREIIRELQESL
jgi:hypothetical protein